MFPTIHQAGGEPDIFYVVIWGLWILAAVMSGAFVLTWFPLAFRALAAKRSEVSLLRIADYAGLQLFVLLAALLTLRTMSLYGIVPPRDELSVFGRVFLPLGIDILVGLRLGRWVRHLWKYRRGGGDPALLSGVSKSSNDPGMPH